MTLYWFLENILSWLRTYLENILQNQLESRESSNKDSLTLLYSTVPLKYFLNIIVRMATAEFVTLRASNKFSIVLHGFSKSWIQVSSMGE